MATSPSSSTPPIPTCGRFSIQRTRHHQAAALTLTSPAAPTARRIGAPRASGCLAIYPSAVWPRRAGGFRAAGRAAIPITPRAASRIRRVPTPTPLLLQKWAALLAKWALAPTSRSRLQLTSAGRVMRHRDRGESPESRRQRHLREDAACTAGARNPASIVENMPATLAVMSKVRAALLLAIQTFPALRSLHRACGSPASRLPPSDPAVAQARRMVCSAIGLDPKDGELHHPSSPLRYAIFEALVVATGDRDEHPPIWLREGTPLGVLSSIPRGGHFPRARGAPLRRQRFSNTPPSWRRTTPASPRSRRPAFARR